MLLSMSKVQIIGPKSAFYEAINVLHRVGTLHIEDFSKRISPGETSVRKMEPDEETEKARIDLENLLVKANSILTTIKPLEKIEISEEEKNRFYNSIWRQNVDELKEEVAHLVQELEEKARGLARRKGDLEMERASIDKYETVVEKIAPLAKQMVGMEGFETVALLIEKRYKAVLDVIRKEMSRITKDQFEVVSADVDEETSAALVIFNKIYSEKVHSFLWAENVNEVRLPEHLADKPFDEALKEIRGKKEEIPEELGSIREKLDKISEEWYTKLLAVRELLQDRIRELQTIGQFGETTYTFVIDGWIPGRRVKEMQTELAKEFGEKVVLAELEASHEDLEEAPIMYDNPGWARPFELVMRLFSPPRYGQIDPTPFLAIFYTVIFGLILGDMGYGLTILLVALLAKRKLSKGYHPVATGIMDILTYAGIGCIVFGAFYGEFFGDTPHKIVHALGYHFPKIHIGAFTLPFERANLEEYILPFLMLALGVGMGHIVLGLVLGVINAVREHSRKHIAEKAGLLMVMVSILAFIACFVVKLPVLQYPAMAILILGIVFLLYGGGIIGVLEIFGTLGKVASYARIMALGLAGVILAVVANKLVGAFGNIAIGLLIAVILHLLNIIVGAFSPSIHALRLNFVEFFGQFYESGGKPYKPFKKTGGERI